MKKEYILFYGYYLDGTWCGHIVGRSYYLNEIKALWSLRKRERKRKKYKCYNYEIFERSVSEWQNIDNDNVLGFNQV